MFSFFTSQKVVEKSPQEKLRELEETILMHSELELGKELIRTDIAIDYPEPNNYLHTLICGEKNEQHPLVLLHGYGGSSITFCRLLKDLSKEYKVLCPDFIGMGQSSRPKIEFETPDGTIDFFVESLESWRKSLGLQKIYMGGFSLGAYFASHYAVKYPDNVNKLFLLAPMGMNKSLKQVSLEEMREKMGFIKRQFFDIMLKAWDSKMTPQKAMKEYSIIAPFALKQFISHSFTFPDEIKDKLYQFFMESFNLPEGSEACIYQLIKPPNGISAYPLEELIPEKVSIDTHVFYGELDHTDKSGAQRIIENNAKENFKLVFIPNTTRQIIVENHELLVQELIAAK